MRAGACCAVPDAGGSESRAYVLPRFRGIFPRRDPCTEKQFSRKTCRGLDAYSNAQWLSNGAALHTGTPPDTRAPESRDWEPPLPSLKHKGSTVRFTGLPFGEVFVNNR